MKRLSKLLALTVVALLAADAAFAGQAAAPVAAKPTNVIAEVRAAIAKNDFTLGEHILADYRQQKGTTSEALEALSWLGRGALARKELDRAETYARETQRLAVAELKKRPLDADRYLPIALGAAIEVQAQVMANEGARTEAVTYLQRELETYKDTSINTRIQKNLNLLTLEGKAAPAISVAEFVGTKPPSLNDLKGRPLVLFFWAHWCPDCKAMAPIFTKLQETYANKGLAIIGPTQLYGYVAGGKDAGKEEEMAHIERIRKDFYSVIPDFPAPVDQEIFKRYGCSTTPTLVLVDRAGIVQLYHPGKMTLDELETHIQKLVN